MGEMVDGKRGNNKHYEFVCEYNGDTANEDAEKALRDGKVCDQRWTRGNVWCGGSKIKYSCRNFPRCPKWLQKEISNFKDSEMKERVSRRKVAVKEKRNKKNKIIYINIIIKIYM